MNVPASPSRLGGFEYRLKVSRYDQVSSMLIALLVLVGVAVFLMLVVWLTNQIFLTQTAVPVEMMELGEGEGPLGGGMELAGPVEEEIGMDSDLEEPAVKDTLAAIADAVGEQAALLDDPALSDQMKSGRGGGSRGDGRGLGRGSGSGSGLARQWEVRFIKGNTLDTYARQLDFFQIELGVLEPGNRVRYASHLTKSRPDTRIGPADQEKRYYLTWRSGDLQQADRELLARAGVEAAGRIILKFLPPALEAQLYNMEKARADSLGEKARRTRFGIVPEGEGYSFFIMDQSYK